MKRLQPFIFFLLFSLFANAQSDTARLIGIHPAVGKTISRDEKIRYNLFPEYADNAFLSAQVYRYNDTTYLLKVTSTKNTQLERPISTAQMDDYYNRIDDVERGQIKDPEYAITTQKKNSIQRTRDRGAEKAYWYSLLFSATITTLQIISAFSR